MLPPLEGKPLSELLRNEQLTLAQILEVMVRAMDRVAAAHALGVFHLNLKPSNIFVRVGSSGRFDDPRVLDLRNADSSTTVDARRASPSTPHYMPIEQLEGHDELDARVDVYAMGVILYEAISGVLPHQADSTTTLRQELLHTPPVHLSLYRPELPHGLADIVMRAIAREPDQRHPSMRALIEDLLRFVPREVALTVRQPESQEPLVRAAAAPFDSTLVRAAAAPFDRSRAQELDSLPGERASSDDLIHAPSSVRLAAPRVPADLSSLARGGTARLDVPSAPPAEAQSSVAPHRTPLRARVLGAVGALSVTAAALAGARLLSWSHADVAQPVPSGAVHTQLSSVGSRAAPAGATSDAGAVSSALAAQPRGTTAVSTSPGEADAGHLPARRERATSATGDETQAGQAPQH